MTLELITKVKEKLSKKNIEELILQVDKVSWYLKKLDFNYNYYN